MLISSMRWVMTRWVMTRWVMTRWGFSNSFVHNGD
jgi:hypothetical protein